MQKKRGERASKLAITLRRALLRFSVKSRRICFCIKIEKKTKLKIKQFEFDNFEK
jgi:hypothetical protein